MVGALGPTAASRSSQRRAQTARGGASRSRRFLGALREDGFTPKRVWFAARRYLRWIEVNPAATVEAQGTMLGELWGTYRLAELERVWPDTRIRFFRQTVFAGARPELGDALERS